MLNEVGRLCVKLAGRDSNKKCVIVDVIDDKHVLIDGETRRRKCNVMHLEPLNQVVKIKKGASHDEVKKVFKDLGIELVDSKKRNPSEKPKRLKQKKTFTQPESKAVKKKAVKASKEEKVSENKEKEVVSEEKKE